MSESIDTVETDLVDSRQERDDLHRNVENTDEAKKQLEDQIIQERQRYTTLEEKTKSWKDRVKAIAEHHIQRIKQLEGELAGCRAASNKSSLSSLKADKGTLTEQADVDVNPARDAAVSAMQTRISLLEGLIDGKNDVLMHFTDLWKKVYAHMRRSEECDTPLDDKLCLSNTAEDKDVIEFGDHVAEKVLFLFNRVSKRVKHFEEQNISLRNSIDQLYSTQATLRQQLIDTHTNESNTLSELDKYTHQSFNHASTEESLQNVRQYQASSCTNHSDNDCVLTHHELCASSHNTDGAHDLASQRCVDVPLPSDHSERDSINSDNEHQSILSSISKHVSQSCRGEVVGKLVSVHTATDNEHAQTARIDKEVKEDYMDARTLGTRDHHDEKTRTDLIERLRLMEMDNLSLREKLHMAEQLIERSGNEICSLRIKDSEYQGVVCKLQLRESELAQQVEVKEKALSDYQASLLAWKERITVAKKSDAEEIAKLKDKLSTQYVELSNVKAVLMNVGANGLSNLCNEPVQLQSESVHDWKFLLRELTQIDETLHECLRISGASDEGGMLDRVQTLLSRIQSCTEDKARTVEERNTVLAKVSELQSVLDAERDRCLRTEVELRKLQENSVDADKYTMIQEANQQLEQRCELLRKEVKRQRDIYQREREQTARCSSSGKAQREDMSELGSTLRAAAGGVFETDMISLAALQTKRDSELKTMRSRVQFLECQNNDLQREATHYNQIIAAYTKEIELCRSDEKTHTSVMYIRNIVHQLLAASPETRPKMIPAIATVLNFTPRQRADVQRANPLCPPLQ